MTIRQRMWTKATGQYGYITSFDAAALGVPVVELGKLAARGGLERITYGVYRFEDLPISERDHLMEAVLWTRCPTAQLSHETALDVWDLCDVNPDRTHVTIPLQRKLRRKNFPPSMAVHYETLTDSNLGWWEGIPTVTPATAIQQSFAAGLRPSLIEQAIDTASARGLLTPNDYSRLMTLLDDRMHA